MRRVLVAVAVIVVVLAGGALAYFGTRDHKTARFEDHLPTRSTIANGLAVGRMHISGGPRMRNGKMPDSPVEGTVEVHHPGDPAVVASVGVDATGGFRIALPPGTYRLVARPALKISPFQTNNFAIRSGQTTPVDLVAIAT
jgi:hypothetical protein